MKARIKKHGGREKDNMSTLFFSCFMAERKECTYAGPALYTAIWNCTNQITRFYDYKLLTIWGLVLKKTGMQSPNLAQTVKALMRRLEVLVFPFKYLPCALRDWVLLAWFTLIFTISSFKIRTLQGWEGMDQDFAPFQPSFK